MDSKVKMVAYNAVVAALYAALTLATYSFSYLGIQFRITEILLFLVFFRKDYIIGLSLGTLIANAFSAIGPIDMLMGTLATVLSCLIIMFSKHMIFTIFVPAVLNGLIVGLELYFFYAVNTDPLWYLMLTVAAGEFAVLLVGYFIFFFLKKNKTIMTGLRANQNLEAKF